MPVSTHAKHLTELAEQGFIHQKQFFDKDDITYLHTRLKQTFCRQIAVTCGYSVDPTDTAAVEAGMVDFFQRYTARFIQTGKTLQHDIALYKLALNDRLLDFIRSLGLHEPSICTRPVVFFNHPRLASNPV